MKLEMKWSSVEAVMLLVRPDSGNCGEGLRKRAIGLNALKCTRAVASEKRKNI